MDSILIIEIDRIYRINKIFSRFPDETVKTDIRLSAESYRYRHPLIDLTT